MLTYTGGLVAMLSGLFGLFIVFSRVFGIVSVPGYTATMVSIIFFGSLNLFSLGIVGSYACRAYENTKHRPLHIVLHSHEFNYEGREGEKQFSSVSR